MIARSRNAFEERGERFRLVAQTIPSGSAGRFRLANTSQNHLGLVMMMMMMMMMVMVMAMVMVMMTKRMNLKTLQTTKTIIYKRLRRMQI